MSQDPLKALARATAHDSRESTKSRIDKERRTQTTARIVRRSLRWSILGFGGIGVALLYFDSIPVRVIGLFSLLIALALAAALFFMGGLAPARVRLRLSDRDRKLLDD